MLVIQLSIATVSIILVLVFSSSSFICWLGSITFGLGLAAVYPTLIVLSETYVNLSGTYASVIFVGASFGDIIYPAVIGQVMTKDNPLAFMIFILITMVLLCLQVVLLIYSGKKTYKFRNVDTTNLESTGDIEIPALELEFNSTNSNDQKDYKVFTQNSEKETEEGEGKE
jgi:MFS family permease